MDSFDHLNEEPSSFRMHGLLLLRAKRSHVNDIYNPSREIFLSQQTEVQVFNVKNMSFDGYAEISGEDGKKSSLGS